MKIKQSKSATSVARTTIFLAVLTELLLLFSPNAWAVPSYSRRYGVDCANCHSMWGALTGKGATFRLSGYRAINGKDIKPTSEDIVIGKETAIPTTLPLSFITGVGYDSRTEKRNADTGINNTSKASSFTLEDASIFLTSPLGPHLSTFVEFPMYETKAWEFTPTGKFQANDTATRGRQFQFVSEKPAFEVAKFFWNNALGDSMPRDSVNLLGGITHLPIGYASGKVRLSVNQYLIYERRALDLISPHDPGAVFGTDREESAFRLGEPQVIAEVNGMLTFGKPVTDVGQKETFWGEYHLGLSNGSNGNADNNTKKDVYGRWVMRYFNQSLGFFAYHSPDQYDDTLRSNGATDGVMSGRQNANKANRLGMDFTLSLVPSGVPLWLENQLMSNRESDPTGFGKEFKWHGGFSQLNWQFSKKSITYLRYDRVKGNAFDDTTVGGITKSKPNEWDTVFGLQHLYDENVKLIFEYRHHEFEDSSMPITAKLKDDGFTARVMFGF
jgi:hypothetical protein